MKLTPDERLYRDLWLAECSRPVAEWHQTAGEKERAEARNAAVMGGGGFVTSAEVRDDCAAQLHTKTGRAGALTPELPALTPEQARAPMNDALPAACRQQVSR